MARFRLSYDLGLRGDYQPLYQWLDELQAEECGDNVATFVSEDSREKLAKSLKRIGKSGGRFYLIGRNEKGKIIGGFVAGRRVVPASWSGAAGHGVDAEEEG